MPFHSLSHTYWVYTANLSGRAVIQQTKETCSGCSCVQQFPPESHHTLWLWTQGPILYYTLYSIHHSDSVWRRHIVWYIFKIYSKLKQSVKIQQIRCLLCRAPHNNVLFCCCFEIRQGQRKAMDAHSWAQQHPGLHQGPNGNRWILALSVCSLPQGRPQPVAETSEQCRAVLGCPGP